MGTTRLPDGRDLGWAEWGSEAGAPVLFFGGAATSRWLGFGADVLEQRNLRLISVDRPGLGVSSPAPGRTLLSWADDVRAFCSARGLRDVRAVGFSAGAPFALACAAEAVVEAVIIVSGTDELAHPSVRSKLVPDVAKLVDQCERDPAAAESFFRGMTAELMWNIVFGMSAECDRAVYAQPDFAAAYRRALEEGFAQGAAGYARDTLLTMTRWPFDPAAIRVPVDLWYGALDTSPVHSPDFGATLAERIPGARRHLVADEGAALLWTRTADILGA